MFEAYLDKVLALGYHVIPMGEAAEAVCHSAPDGEMKLQSFPGREGELACQQ